MRDLLALLYTEKYDYWEFSVSGAIAAEQPMAAIMEALQKVLYVADEASEIAVFLTLLGHDSVLTTALFLLHVLLMTLSVSETRANPKPKVRKSLF